MFLVAAELLFDALAVQDFGLQIQLDTVLPCWAITRRRLEQKKRNGDDYEGEESPLLRDI